MFLTLVPKILPLYFLIFLGFVGGRWLGVSSKSVANLIIYLISPVVFFGYVSQVNFTWARAFLPILTFSLPCLLSFIWLKFSRRFFVDSRSILGTFASASSNLGYFGIPVFIALFGSENLGLYALAIVGYMLFECGPGFYFLARGKYNISESLRRAVLLPALYSAILGIIFSVSGWQVPPIIKDMIADFRGAYVVIGMMLIGVALSKQTKLNFDWRFIIFSCVGKFVIMPILALLFIFLLSKIFFVRDLVLIHVLLVFSCVPIGANFSAYTAQLDFHPERGATVVFVSTLIAMIYLPLAIPCLLMLASSFI